MTDRVADTAAQHGTTAWLLLEAARQTRAAMVTLRVLGDHRTVKALDRVARNLDARRRYEINHRAPESERLGEPELPF